MKSPVNGDFFLDILRLPWYKLITTVTCVELFLGGYTMTEKENLLKMIHHEKGLEWIPIDAMCFDLCADPYDVIRERPMVAEQKGRDWFGCGWQWNADTNGWAPMHEHPICDDITLWREQIKFPDLDAVDWEKAATRAATWDRDGKLSIIFWESGCWERLHALCGFQESLMYLYTEPEAVHELMNAIAEHKCRVVEKIAQYYNPDIVCIFDDFGHQNAPFMSSEMFREFILPYDKRVGDALKAHDIMYAHHSCGKIDPLFDDIMDMGPMMILGLFLPYNDVAAVNEKYADRVVILAGSNTQKLLNPGTTVEECVEETKRLLDLYAPCQNLIFDVAFSNPAHIPAMIETVKTYGQEKWFGK